MGFCVLAPLPGPNGAARAQGRHGTRDATLVLRAAPEDKHVFLVWNDVPEARYEVRWRRSGSVRWSTLPRLQTSAVVSDLQNDVIYEFQVAATVRDRKLQSSPLRASPRRRTECIAGNSGYFCSVEALQAYQGQFAADRYLQCGSQVLTELAIDSPNCWYRTARGTAVLNRFFGDEYLPPPTHPSTAEIRTLARHALWPEGDPFASPAQFSHQIFDQPGHDGGRVDRASYEEVNAIVVDDGSELKSRISWFSPAAPVRGHYAIYYEGHGLRALRDGADVIEWLLRRGWQVIALDMPLAGANAIDRNPPYTEHEDLGFDPRGTSPMDPFLLPVKVVVDSIYRAENRPEILMVGRSGGAAMGSVYAMLDERIMANVNISGGAPETLVYDTLKVAQGDYEQMYAPLLDVVPRDLQLLAGGTRGSFFFYSKFDTCCFRFDASDSWIGYLSRASESWGKPVQVSLDVTRRHGLSDKGFSELDAFLKAVNLWAPQARPTPADSGGTRAFRARDR